jgi:hypothetical protein
MNAKDAVVGTAKQIVAEIVGGGRLAEEGSRQAGGNRLPSASDADVDGLRQNGSRPPDAPGSAARRAGTAVRCGGGQRHHRELPCGILHDRHPKTAHLPKPSMIA